MTHRYVVTARKLSGTVEITDRADKVTAKYGGQVKEAEAARAGTAFWATMRASGVTQEQVNGFSVFEESPDGVQIGSVHPILEGARVVYFILYRADKDASAYKALGTRQRIGDALDALFDKARREIVLPHKP